MCVCWGYLYVLRKYAWIPLIENNPSLKNVALILRAVDRCVLTAGEGLLEQSVVVVPKIMRLIQNSKFIEKNLTVLKSLLEELCYFLFVFLKLSDPSDLPRNAFRIFTILVDFLCIEHIDYALETGLAGQYV